MNFKGLASVIRITIPKSTQNLTKPTLHDPARILTQIDLYGVIKHMNSYRNRFGDMRARRRCTLFAGSLAHTVLVQTLLASLALALPCCTMYVKADMSKSNASELVLR